MEPDAEFYRPDRTNEPAEPSMAELRERARLCAQIANDLRLIGSVDVAELEILEKRLRAIASDLKTIHDSDVVKELEAER